MTIKEKAKRTRATKEQVAKVIKEVVKPKFTKQQLLQSQKYVNRRDALNALLKDDESYTHEQVDEILEKFYKGGNK
ncbi:MAG: hypothetical protein GX072_04485 [Lysinibacillus sp.]|nr:hypothetical protein [Lysinibacillus sp.]